MIVITAYGTMRRAAAGPLQCGENRFLHACLSDRPRHAKNAGRRAIPCHLCQRMQGSGRILDKNMGVIDRTINDGRCRAIGEGCVKKAVAIHRFPFERNEQVACLHIARIHFNTADLELTRCLAAGCLSNLGGVPQCKTQATNLLVHPCSRPA